MEFGDRSDTDRSLNVGRRLVTDEYGSIEQYAHPLLERIDELCGKPFKIRAKRLRGWGAPDVVQRGAGDPSLMPGWAQLRHRPACDGDRDLFAGLCATENFAYIVAKFLLRDGGHEKQSSRSATHATCMFDE